MDPSRDNPLFRFEAFWWAVGLFLLFAVALVIVGIASRRPVPTLEDYAAATRYEIRAKVDAAQRAKLDYKMIEEGKTVQVPPAVVFGEVGRQLVESKPAAVEKPEQSVTGSATAPQ